MNFPLGKTPPVVKIINATFIDLPAFQTYPSDEIWDSLNTNLNRPVSYYTPSVTIALSSVIHITQDVQYGWLLRNFHANGASIFLFAFISIFLVVYARDPT